MERTFEQNNAVVVNQSPGGSPEPNVRKIEGFFFLPSYLESYEAFMRTGNKELAREFLDSVIAYGTERKRITDNPLVRAVMASVEKTIDAGAAKQAETERKKQERAAKRGQSEGQG